MQNTQTPWWGKIGLLWLIFVPLCFIIYVLAQPLAPHDFWYHLRAGAWMMEHLQYPREAMFTPSVPPHTAYFYQSWIAEILMFLTFKWTGLAGSQVVRAACFGSCMIIFVAIAQNRTKVLLPDFNQRARRVAIAALIGMTMCLPNTDLRPQAFSLPLFAIFVAIIFAWPRATQKQFVTHTAWITVLMALWANLHGAFATGLILLATFCLGETIYYWCSTSFTSWLGKRLNKSQLYAAWIALGAAIIAACANPKGWGIYAYVAELTGNVINIKFNQEWQPPTWNDGVDALYFCCGIAILLMLLLLAVRYYEKKRTSSQSTVNSTLATQYGSLCLRPGELLIIAAFFVMALRNVRSIIWFALLFVVAGAVLLCGILPAHQTCSSENITSRLQKCNLSISILLCLFTVPFLPWFKPLLPWPQSYLKQFIATPDEFSGQPPMLLSNLTPAGTANFLRQSPPQGLLWNDMVLGSYLVWALYPEQGPWADPRIELRPDSFWYQYMDTCHAKNDPARALVREGFSDALINKEATFQEPLRTALAKSPMWHKVCEDQTAVLFRYRQWHP